MLTIGKMLRKGTSHFNARDTAAIEELKKNMKLYLTTDIMLLDYLRLVNLRFKRANIDKEKRDNMLLSILDVKPEVLKKAGVRQKDYD